MMASTSRMGTNPPSVYEVTRPSSHRMIRITAIVQSRSIFALLQIHSCTRFSHRPSDTETLLPLGRCVAGIAKSAFGVVGDFINEVLGVSHVLAYPANHGLAAIGRVVQTVLRRAANKLASILARL